MAMGNGSITPNILFSVSPSTGAFANQSLPIQLPIGLTLLYGTGGNNLGNLLSYTALAFAASPISLDLTSLTDPFGAAVNPAKVRLFVWANFSNVSGNDFMIGNAGTNEFNGFISSGGILRCPASVSTSPYDGFVIQSFPRGLTVDGTHKAVKCDPGANTFSAALFVVGSST